MARTKTGHVVRRKHRCRPVERKVIGVQCMCAHITRPVHIWRLEAHQNAHACARIQPYCPVQCGFPGHTGVQSSPALRSVTCDQPSRTTALTFTHHRRPLHTLCVPTLTYVYPPIPSHPQLGWNFPYVLMSVCYVLISDYCYNWPIPAIPYLAQPSPAIPSHNPHPAQ